MSRTRHHHDAISPRRYALLDWAPRRRVLRAIWRLREVRVNRDESVRAVVELDSGLKNVRLSEFGLTKDSLK